MVAQKILNSDRARRLCQRNLSPRYRKLDKLEAYVECRQYEGRKPWTDNAEVPLRERAPSINYPAVEQAIESNNDFVLGEGRWPEFTTFSSENDREFDADFGLNQDDSSVLDFVIKKAIKQSRLPAIAAEVLGAAQACGTGAAVFGLRKGKLTCEAIRAKWCTPTFADGSTTELASLEIRYPYVEQYYHQDAKGWAERCMLYRRVITATDDIVYQPIEAPESGNDPEVWPVDRTRSVKHNLGFCPVRWYPFLATVRAANQIDGEAIHEGRFELLDALNFGLSQKDRAAFYCGDPQLVESGVGEDEEPAQTGRPAHVITTPSGFAAVTGGGRRGAVRRRGAATIWRYTDPQAKAYYLSLGADALKALDDNCRDLRAKVQEALKVVFIDPEHVKHAAEFSNKAIRTMLKTQLARCDRIREDFGDNFLIPAVCMMLRIAFVVNKQKPGSVYLPGLAKAMPILERFERRVEGLVAPPENDEQADDGASIVWFDPHIDLTWGPYFEPDPQEESQIGQTVAILFDKKVIDRKTAVRRLPDTYGIDNPDAYVESLETDEALEHARQMELMHAMNRTADGDGRGMEPDGGGEDATGGTPPSPAPRARGGSASAAASAQ